MQIYELKIAVVFLKFARKPVAVLSIYRITIVCAALFWSGACADAKVKQQSCLGMVLLNGTKLRVYIFYHQAPLWGIIEHHYQNQNRITKKCPAKNNNGNCICYITAWVSLTYILVTFTHVALDNISPPRAKVHATVVAQFLIPQETSSFPKYYARNNGHIINFDLTLTI